MSFLTRAFRAPDPPEQVSNALDTSETRDWSLTDPQVLALFGATPSLSGVSVNDRTAMGLSAVYRCVSLISGSIASLPLRTVVTALDGTTQTAASFLDDPGGPNGLTPFEWSEYMMVSLLLHGNAYFHKVYGGGGQLMWLTPIPPQCVGIEVKQGQKFYRVQLVDNSSQLLTDADILHIPGISLDGVTGVSPLHIARNSFGSAIAGERTAARLFSNGLLASAIITPEDELTDEQAIEVKAMMDRRMTGEAHAHEPIVVNRRMKITPWSINPEQAEFLSSRAFAIDEVSRWYGVPPHLLGQTEKQTSFGAGLSEQNRGYAKYTLEPWTCRIEARLSRLLGPTLKAEYDFHSLVSPDPETEITLLIQQYQAGVLSLDEVRAILNRAPKAVTE